MSFSMNVPDKTTATTVACKRPQTTLMSSDFCEQNLITYWLACEIIEFYRKVIVLLQTFAGQKLNFSLFIVSRTIHELIY